MTDGKRKVEEEVPPDGTKRAKVEGEERPKNVSSVLEKAKKALEMQSKLKQRLESIKKAKSEDKQGAETSSKREGPKQLKLIQPEELYEEEGDSFYDPMLGYTRRSQRKIRPTLQFIEEGSLKRQAEIARLKAEFGDEYVKKLEEKGGHLAEAREDDDLLKREASGAVDMEVEETTPSVEWWDERILVDKGQYPSASSWAQIDDKDVRLDRITHYIEHPVELEPPLQQPEPEPAPLKLTRKEMKKLRTQRRQAREAEKQELVRQGLLEPPKPKVKISNLMRVLGSESTADPTAIELEVSKQMAERRAAHEDRNLARMLTPAERREKKMKKLLDFVPGSDVEQREIKVAVYKIKDLSRPQHRFKVQANARENHMSGIAIIVPGSFSVVVVEGGPKTLRRYEKLMLHRIKWNLEEDDEESVDQGANSCHLVWNGIVASSAFKGKFKTREAASSLAGRKILDDHGVAHYWDMAASSEA